MSTDDRNAGSAASVLAPVARYYSEKLAAFGPTARGADWNSAESQEIRFRQLGLLFGSASGFSINDLGCGYGAFLEYLESRGTRVDYRGFDISADMIHAATERNRARANAAFFQGSRPAAPADYSVASGIFNVKLNADDAGWLRHIDDTLDEMNRSSIRGFAFNCLTLYSDPERRSSHLYYGDPRRFFDACMTRYSRHVTLLHDYGLYEFTMIVRKDGTGQS